MVKFSHCDRTVLSIFWLNIPTDRTHQPKSSNFLLWSNATHFSPLNLSDDFHQEMYTITALLEVNGTHKRILVRHNGIEIRSKICLIKVDYSHSNVVTIIPHKILGKCQHGRQFTMTYTHFSLSYSVPDEMCSTVTILRSLRDIRLEIKKLVVADEWENMINGTQVLINK